MEIILSYLFWFIGLVGFVWLVVVAFRKHIGWGFGVLLLPPLMSIAFVVTHWRAARIPFALFVFGTVLQIAALFGVWQQLFPDRSRLAEVMVEFRDGDLTGEQAVSRLALELAQRADTSGRLLQSDLDALRRDIQLEAPPTMSANDMENMVDQVISELPGSVTLPSSAVPPDEQPQDEPQTGEAEPEIASTAPASPVVKIPAPPPPKKKVRQPITLAEAPQHIGEYMVVVNRRGIRREGVLVSIGPEKLKFQREILGAGGYMEFAIKRGDIAGLELQ
jgi:hypothetical protein